MVSTECPLPDVNPSSGQQCGHSLQTQKQLYTFMVEMGLGLLAADFQPCCGWEWREGSYSRPGVVS